mgnify:CR=1 FL=1
MYQTPGIDDRPAIPSADLAIDQAPSVVGSSSISEASGVSTALSTYYIRMKDRLLYR